MTVKQFTSTLGRIGLTSLFSLFIFQLSAFNFQLFAQTPPQRNFDLTVSPVFLEFDAKPGDTVGDKIRVRNNTDSEIPIKVEVKKLGGDTTGNVTIQETTDDSSLNWIKIKDTSIKTGPREWTNVPLTISVPKNAAFGYYWVVSFTQTKDSDVKSSGAGVKAALAVPILLNVKSPGAKADGKITSFKTDKGVYEYLPSIFTTTIENIGNVHVRPRGNIFIKDWKGTVVDTLTINDAQGSVLPNTKKAFENSWNNSFIWLEDKIEDGKTVLDKNGKPKKSLKIRFDKMLDLRVGKYTANSIIVIPTEKRDIALEQNTSFIVFPWKIIGGAALFIIFAALGAFSTARSAGRKTKAIFAKIFKK